MTDYGSMSHQDLYNYVHSGSPSTIQAEADTSTQHSQSVTEATQELQTTLAGIQSSWSGAAADQFSQQANALVAQMNQHASDADTVGQVMTYASSSLTWAQKYMPSPPSEAEQLLADIDSNAVTGVIAGIFSGGTANIASEVAKQDIANKKQAATQVMTQLASAYTQAQAQLPNSQGSYDDPSDPSSANKDRKGNGQVRPGDGSSNSGGVVAAPIVYPMSMGSSNAGGDSSSIGSGSDSVNGGSRTGKASGGGTYQRSGSISDPYSPTTVTSGIDGTAATGSGYGVTGGSNGIVGSGSAATGGSVGAGTNSSGVASGGFSGGASEFAASGFGRTSGLASTDNLEDSGGGRGVGSGGRGLAADAGNAVEEAGGRGYGSQPSIESIREGSGSTSGGTSIGGRSGEGEVEGNNPDQMGMMNGMGRGTSGGKDDRGSRASWLKEDRDYWYGDKYKNAAPPGGVIE